MPEFPSREAFESAFPNIKGTAIGEGDTLLVLVTRKVPEDELHPHEIVPTSVSINGETYVTDLMEVSIPHLIALTPPINFENTDPGDHQERHRPIPGGVSVGNSSVGAGTVGTPKVEFEGDPVQLTNAHVVGSSSVHYQPASIDGGNHETPFATTREKSELDPDEVQTTDSALLDVSPPEIATHILGIGELARFGDADLFSRSYKKSGRTTAVSEGDLRGRDASLNVTYGPNTIRFTGVDVFSDMSEPGDSGSLIGYETEDGFVGTNLLFAGSDRVTVAIPMNAVMDYHGELKPWNQDDDPDEDYPWWMRLLFAIINGIRDALSDR